MAFPTPHLEKINKTLANDQLPDVDRPRIQEFLNLYRAWIVDLEALRTARFATLDEGAEFIAAMTALLTSYRNHLDVDLIFDSPADFLYRQKGQLKLDNSVIEEFLPRLMEPFLPQEIAETFDIGPHKCFSSIFFAAAYNRTLPGGGLQIRSKDQDFSISRKLYLKASLQRDFTSSSETSTHLAHVAIELKTNLDKTMFQEASATAVDVKRSVSGSKYFLTCDWLDMTPISTAATEIDEVLILRGKRLGSNVRKMFARSEGRIANRELYVNFLAENPFRVMVLSRLVAHVVSIFNDEDPIEESVLVRGYF